MSKTCIHCNKEYAKPINCSKVSWQKRKYCSRACAYLVRDIGKRVFQCIACEKAFSGRYKKNPSYCSQTCKNRAWRGGLDTRLTKAIRSNHKYAGWRSDILTRDNWKCKTCGNKEQLEIHHIESLAKIIKKEEIEFVGMIKENSMLWDRNNGVTLCKPCHKKTDSYMKRIYYKIKFS